MRHRLAALHVPPDSAGAKKAEALRRPGARFSYVRKQVRARGRCRRPQLVRRERLTPGLGDARLRARKEERAAGAGADRRRARVAWIAAARRVRQPKIDRPGWAEIRAPLATIAVRPHPRRGRTRHGASGPMRVVAAPGRRPWTGGRSRHYERAPVFVTELHDTAKSSIPISSSRVAQKWRRSCQRMFGRSIVARVLRIPDAARTARQ
jgi:hypothetical protein